MKLSSEKFGAPNFTS